MEFLRIWYVLQLGFLDGIIVKSNSNINKIFKEQTVLKKILHRPLALLRNSFQIHLVVLKQFLVIIKIIS